MEKLKRKVQEIIKDDQEYKSDPDYKESRESYEVRKFDNLKPEINEFLWRYFPDDITLLEMETLAMAINDLIINPRNYLGNIKD